MVGGIREICTSSGSESKAQGLDHACPLGPGARSARLLFSVLRFRRLGLSHSFTFRDLETLGGHRDWFGKSWEGLLGRSWPGGKVEGYSDFCPPDHGLVRSSCMLT